MSPVQGKSPPVQVKEPYGNLDMVTCRLTSCNPECTPAYNTRKRVRQYIEKERKAVCCVITRDCQMLRLIDKQPFLSSLLIKSRERIGSVVECLT